MTHVITLTTLDKTTHYLMIRRDLVGPDTLDFLAATGEARCYGDLEEARLVFHELLNPYAQSPHIRELQRSQTIYAPGHILRLVKWGPETDRIVATTLLEVTLTDKLLETLWTHHFPGEIALNYNQVPSDYLDPQWAQGSWHQYINDALQLHWLRFTPAQRALLAQNARQVAIRVSYLIN